MVTDKNSRHAHYLKAVGNRDPILARGTQAFQEYNEGDVPKSSTVTVGKTIDSALACFFHCECRHDARFSPADMRRRRIDESLPLWEMAKKMRCTTCNRTGRIVRITRVRVSAAKPEEL